MRARRSNGAGQRLSEMQTIGGDTGELMTAMAFFTTDDRVKLYYEETGSGTPVVFVH